MTGEPCDWDQQSYCTTDGCHRPATHRSLTGLVADTPVYELVCCQHAIVDAPAVTFTFRAPGPYLSMNDRDHWRTRGSKVKAWRTIADLTARQIAYSTPAHADVWIQLDQWDSRHRDPMNYHATTKACVDGMVDAGCWPDDTPEYVHTNEPTFRVIPRGQAKSVTVTITKRAS